MIRHKRPKFIGKMNKIWIIDLNCTRSKMDPVDLLVDLDSPSAEIKC